MQVEVSDLDDPRIADYRNLKDRELARQGARFMAEGRHVVNRLLQSRFPVESVLVDSRRLRWVDPAPPAETPVYVAPPGVVDKIVGYKFHAGILAIGRRTASPSIDDVMQQSPEKAMLVVCPNLRATENLGSIIRSAAGFGASAVILGEQSCDPFYRRTIRVSMGTVFSLPIIQCNPLLPALQEMQKKYGVHLAATVLDKQAEILSRARRPDRLALMLGSEDQGLPDDLIAIADQRLTLPMNWGTDSLNVAIAAGIFLYHFAYVAGG